MAQKVPRIIVGQIGAVGDEGGVLFSKVFLHLFTAAKYQRPYQIIPFRRDSAKAFNACSSRRIKKHGLKVIVGGVSCGDNSPTLFIKNVVTHIASRKLDALSAFFSRTLYVYSEGFKRNLKLLAQVLNKFLIPKRLLAPELMVYMYCFKKLYLNVVVQYWNTMLPKKMDKSFMTMTMLHKAM